MADKTPQQLAAELAARVATASKRIDPATYGLPAAPVADVRAIRSAFAAALEAGCNLLAPETQIDHIPRGYAISLRIVAIDAGFAAEQTTAKSNGLWYMTDGAKLALHYSPSLNLLAQTAGVDWLDSHRTDDGRIACLWRHTARAQIRLFDGTERREIANHELDLTNGSPEASPMTEKALQKARAKGAMLCESKCKARVIRALLGLRASYTRAEAARPFVYPALVWMPGDSPEVARMIAAKELGIVEEVFGPRRAARVIDTSAEPVNEMLLEDHGEPAEPEIVTEQARLAARQTVSRGPPADEDAPPFAAEPETWMGTAYTFGDVVAYCEAKHWPDPRKANAADHEKLAVWLRGVAGAKDIDGFLGAGG